MHAGDELLLVTGVSHRTGGGNLVVSRAYGGTKAASHRAGSTLYLVKTGTSIGDAQPGVVQPRSVVTSKIGQATSSPGQVNTITVTLSVNSALDIPAVSKIIIKGLTGSGTGSGNVLSSLAIADVGSPSATSKFGSSGWWNQTEGSLTLVLASGQSLAADTLIVFSFDLMNPSNSQVSSPTFVSAECVHSDAVLHYTTDGSAPASTSSSTFSTPVTVPQGQTLTAIAAYSDQRDSNSSAATYT